MVSVRSLDCLNLSLAINNVPIYIREGFQIFFPSFSNHAELAHCFPSQINTLPWGNLQFSFVVCELLEVLLAS